MHFFLLLLTFAFATKLSFKRKEYLIFSEDYAVCYLEASAFCSVNNGQLVRIESCEERDFLASHICSDSYIGSYQTISFSKEAGTLTPHRNIHGNLFLILVLPRGIAELGFICELNSPFKYGGRFNQFSRNCNSILCRKRGECSAECFEECDVNCSDNCFQEGNQVCSKSDKKCCNEFCKKCANKK